MTPAQFKTKWAKFSGKEIAAYAEHFTDLCRMLGEQTPIEADPTGNDTFCFQKHVEKDSELLDFDRAEDAEPETRERGFADVWKRGCFAWEYKGKKKNLDEAYKQLLRYRESLLNPPLLVVCDFDRYVIRTNFNGTVQEVHEFTNAQIDDPGTLLVLRALFSDPDFLRPQRTTAEVTEKLAGQIADVAKSLQKRESRELANAKTRAEMNFTQRKNLRIARFLNRVVFCFFAEDTGLLPKNLFSDIARTALDDPKHFAHTLETLFGIMATGGTFGRHKIRYFNGHLFEESSVFELTEGEMQALAAASEADWQFIQPSIMGTLFERALEPEQRSQLGAHYTSEGDIRTLVEPVLMAPLRREWSALKGKIAPAYAKDNGPREQREALAAFQKKLAAVTVLDPACGSGNFLYVSLQLLLDLEKEVITRATELGFNLAPQVSVQQLRAIEINPYAFELAQVSVQIGFLQWRRDNGFDNDRSPVLQNLDGFQNEDALLVPHFRNKAKTLKEAQAGEHEGDDALRFYTERTWPKCDVIVGNPPFLGNKRVRSELGDSYAKAVFDTFSDRLPATSDFCCYWFEKAREQIEKGNCRRAGLLATTGSKQVASRQALERIQLTCKIFFAISDRSWFDAGTAIRICMVGFGAKDVIDKPILDGNEKLRINPDLSAGLNLTRKQTLKANRGVCFMGSTKVGDFDIDEKTALTLLHLPNAAGKPNSDVLRLFRNGSDIVRADSKRWVIDYGLTTPIDIAARYEAPFKHLEKFVHPFRLRNNRAHYREKWWIHAEPRPGLRDATARMPRYLATARVAKHRLFVWFDPVVLPDSKVIAFAFSDDFHFGLLQSRIHDVWTAATQGLHGGERPTYNPTECFETFPFPSAASSQQATISASADDLNVLRERWLNPPEWTRTQTLTFPGSASGPWARYIDPRTIDLKTNIGTVRYPRLEPRDADCAAELKRRTLTNLYNERPKWLALAHASVDAAVAAAYGWPSDLSDDDILSRLLDLNFQRAAEQTTARIAETPPKRRGSREKDADEML